MLKPLYDHVVLKQKEVEKTTASGILLTTSSNKDNPAIAEVIAVGNGRVVDGKVEPLIVKKGDSVIYKDYAGTRIKYEGEEYLIVSESDILATIE